MKENDLVWLNGEELKLSSYLYFNKSFMNIKVKPPMVINILRILDFIIIIFFIILLFIFIVSSIQIWENSAFKLTGKIFVYIIILFLFINIILNIISFNLLKNNYTKWLNLSLISKFLLLFPLFTIFFFATSSLYYSLILLILPFISILYIIYYKIHLKIKRENLKIKYNFIGYIINILMSLLLLLVIFLGTYEFFIIQSSDWIQAKPVIYLYPTQTTDIKVQLNYKWKLIADYPEYDEKINWWEVEAYPDGTLINKADNKEYSYLFWEWKPDEPINWDLSKWFVIPWENTREFLQETLSKMWLTPKEYNEFIVYWYPLMKDNKYNLIHFAEEQYTDIAPLEITPKPDSVLRVFMVFKWLDEKIEIEKQEMKNFERKWFSVIEWGGTEIE